MPAPYENARINVIGTMYSGNSFTTVNNTLRQLEYIGFILHREKIKAHPIVAGDDVLIISDQHNYMLFDAVWRNYFSDTGKGVHGLG